MVISSTRLDASSMDDLDSQAGVRRTSLKRRGLSRFYSSKSQSFSNMRDLVANPFSCSSLLLAKKASCDNLERVASWCGSPSSSSLARRPLRLTKGLSSSDRALASLQLMACDSTWEEGRAWPCSPCYNSSPMAAAQPLFDGSSLAPPTFLPDHHHHLQQQHPPLSTLGCGNPLEPWAEELCSALAYTQLGLAPHQVALPTSGAPPAATECMVME
jgi:hypothetical protein